MDHPLQTNDIEMKSLIEAAQAMLNATAHLTDQMIVEARIRLVAALKCGDDRHHHDIERAERRTRNMAEHPYPMGPME